VILGKPDGGADAVVHALVDLLRDAGYDAAHTRAIRQEIWIKMLLVVGPSPVSALTGGTVGDLLNDEASRTLIATVMREGAAIGRRLGFAIPDDIDAMLAFYRGKPVRPSLLQDFEARRTPELDNGILAFSAIAAALDLRVPALDNVATLVRLKRDLSL
jgi:2-dehydropantoate 2-reductase